jgi:hypothetical protein
MSQEKVALEGEHIEQVDPILVADELGVDETLEVLDARAAEATEAEHALSPLQAVRAYPMAIFWSFMVSMCVIMEGYDTIL